MNIINEMAEENLNNLKNSDYPGRGIIAGITPSGKELVQIYWTMGRSKNSKNRIMLSDGDNIKTIPYDRTLEVIHEDLIIYNVSAKVGNKHIVTNGKQTDTISDYFTKNDTFEEALYQWEYENDIPIYTSRISCFAAVDGVNSYYAISIIKALEQNPSLLTHQFFKYKPDMKGYGHCIHTYSLSQTCMPFSGEPYWIRIFNDINDNANYWNILPKDKRVALYVKHINISNGEVKDKICNIH